MFEELPPVDGLEDVIGPVVEDPFEEEGPPDNRQGESGGPLGQGVVEPAQHCHVISGSPWGTA